MRTLYAFLVGIDDYEDPVPPLRGCINDIEAAELVLGDVCKATGIDFKPAILKNAEATRDAFVDGFRGHLAKAGANDVALLYFAGHGSQEDAPQSFWHVEPDRLNETLVLFDSRREGSWDLADKELRGLLAELAANAAHLVCILDCCHSGSMTKSIDVVRRAPIDKRQRPADAFLGAQAMAAGAEAGQADWDVLPPGKHVLMAACRPEETAKEVLERGRQRGAFSAALMKVLHESDGRISYRDLMKRADAQVRQRTVEQTPQLELSDGSDARRLFFGNASVENVPYFSLRFDSQQGWVIDGGAIHGFAPPNGDETTTLAIFPLGGTAEEYRRFENALAVAIVESVRPESSHVSFTSGQEKLDDRTTYRAVVTATPLPPVQVHLSGEDAIISEVRAKLASAAAGSVLLRNTDDEATADFRVKPVDGGGWRIERAGGSPRPVSLAAADVDGVQGFIDLLEHMARWHVIATLRNPLSRLSERAAALSLSVPVAAEAKSAWTGLKSASPLVSYVKSAEGWHAPRLRVLITNNSPSEIYVALLWLSEDWAVSSSLSRAAAQKLQPGVSISALEGQPIEATIPNPLWQEGVTRLNDRLKLIASTEQFDPSLFDQAPLGTRTKSVQTRSPFERLGGRLLYRDLGPSAEAIADWTTIDLTLTVVRPPEAERVVDWPGTSP